MIYLDNAATTKVFPQVKELMSKVQEETFGNPSSLHRAGIMAEHVLKQAREEIMDVLSAQKGQFVFTAGGTEANNLAILGTMLSRIKRKPRIIFSPIEHPSVSETMEYLRSLGADCQEVKVSATGQVDTEHLKALLEEETALVSIMTVNNEIGVTQDIATLVGITKSKNPKTLFHTDAVQAFGKIPLSVETLGIDLLSVSGHKINGPKGVGGLYIRPGVHVKPIIFGGGQEGGLRSGTQNTAAIAGFGLAASLTKNAMADTIQNMKALKAQLEEGLKAIPGCTVITGENSAPHIVCGTFPGIKSETLLHTLEAEGIYVSSGSACSSNKPRLSPTLLAIKRERKEIDGAIRFSLGKDTKKEDIATVLSVLQREVPLLLSISR